MVHNSSSLPPPRWVERDPLLPWLGDHHLPYVVPVVFYWIISFIFHFIETRGLLSKYKLHTSAEDLTKNRASRKDVIKFALFQQAAQCVLGYLMADDMETFMPHEYSVALWAQRLRDVEIFASQLTYYAIRIVPWIVHESYLPGMTSGKTIIERPFDGLGGSTTQTALRPTRNQAPFSTAEMSMANLMYWVLYPVFQYAAALILADTFQYFTHRLFHVNRWLYKHIHSMHHDIYVPFAYGAYYNHPLETIPIDAIGSPMCLALAGLNNRQAALFGALWTFKSVVDHCGYDFPYNPCNLVCPNSVLHHDLHHQTWGLKYNFSVYGSVWDRIMGTLWSPHDGKAQAKYEKGRAVAEAAATKRRLQRSSAEPTVGVSTAVSI